MLECCEWTFSFCLFLVDPSPTPPKKSKQPCYELNKRQKALIKADSLNKKLWDEIVGESRKKGTVSTDTSSELT